MISRRNLIKSLFCIPLFNKHNKQKIYYATKPLEVNRSKIGDCVIHGGNYISIKTSIEPIYSFRQITLKINT